MSVKIQLSFVYPEYRCFRNEQHRVGKDDNSTHSLTLVIVLELDIRREASQRSVEFIVGRALLYHGLKLKAQIPLGSSRLDSTRLDTFDVLSPCILAVELVEQHGSTRSTRRDRQVRLAT